MRIIKEFLLLASIMIAMVIAVAACGVPQPIHGRAYSVFQPVPGFQLPIYRAAIGLYNQGDTVPFETIQTNPFGYYKFGAVLPCSSYEVRIRHKWYSFQTPIIMVDPEDFPGDSDGVTVDFIAIMNL